MESCVLVDHFLRDRCLLVAELQQNRAGSRILVILICLIPDVGKNEVMLFWSAGSKPLLVRAFALQELTGVGKRG